MSYVLGVALYFVIWWITLFAVLPFGIRSQFEEGEVVVGTEGAAPARPHMLRKFLITTVLAAVIWFIVYLFVSGRIISIYDVPIGPTVHRGG